MGFHPSSGRIWSRTFILILAVSFLLFLSMYMLLSTLPIYAQTLGGNETIAGTIVGIFTFSAVLARPLFGNLLDRKGRRIILIVGVAICLAAIIGYNLAFHIATLLALRVVNGIGWSATTTASMTVASDVIPAEKRAEGMGYYGVASVAAMSLGPALGLFLIKSTTPSTLFITASVVAAVGLGASLLVSYEKSPEVIARRAAIRPTRGVVLEKTAIPPSLVLLFITLTYGGIISFIPLYAGSRGVPNIGLFFTVYAVVLLFSRPLIGRLADRLGGRWFLPPGILLIVVALVLLTRANSLTLFLLCGAIYGLGFAAVQPILSALIVSLAPPERRGAANATFAIAMDLGIGLGSILLGFIIQKLGYESMYGISAIFAGIALIVYYALLRKRMPRHSGSFQKAGETTPDKASGASPG